MTYFEREVLGAANTAIRALQYKATPWRPFGPGSTIQNLTQNLTGVLSFTVPTNLALSVNKGLVAASLSFTGAIIKALIKPLVAATLTFTGPINLVKNTSKRITASLTFTGPVNLLRAISKSMTGVLSFTGPVNLLKATTKTLVAAGLVFAGSIAKQTNRALTSTLSFTGAFGPNVVQKKMTAVLSFTGAQAMRVGKGMTGVLSFTGATLRNAITKGMTATLVFVGTTTKATTKGLVAAGLSFTGALVSGKFLHQALAATLSFTGTFIKQPGKSLTAVLSFTGPVKLRLVIVKGITGGLSFVGARSIQISKVITAALNLTGSTTKRTARGLTGALSFLGSLVSGGLGRTFTLALSATLNFAGSISRGRYHAFVASMKPTATLTNIRWYLGTFKQVSRGFFRAVYRGIRSIITQNRNQQ